MVALAKEALTMYAPGDNSLGLRREPLAGSSVFSWHFGFEAHFPIIVMAGTAHGGTKLRAATRQILARFSFMFSVDFSLNQWREFNGKSLLTIHFSTWNLAIKMRERLADAAFSFGSSVLTSQNGFFMRSHSAEALRGFA